MNKRINLDVVRILAAWMVLSVHIGQHAGFDFSVGQKGVQVFFILSGYLSFASLSKNPSIKDYYKKRMVRILPLYWICLVLIYIEDIILGIYSLSLSDVLAGQCGPQFLRYFVFMQCFTPTDNWNLWNNHGALWTMSSFVGFYIVAPFLFRLMKNFYVSLVMLVTLMLGRPYLVTWIQNVFSDYPAEAHIEWFASMNPLAELYCFLLGSVLFVAIREKKQIVYAFIFIMAMVVTAFTWYQYELLSVLLILLAVSFNPITDNVRICKWLSAVSGGSFALYLVHPMVLQVAPSIWDKIGIGNKWLYIIYLYVLCIGIAYALYYLFISKIERYISGRFLKPSLGE